VKRGKPGLSEFVLVLIRRKEYFIVQDEKKKIGQ